MRLIWLSLCSSFALACSPDAPGPPPDPQAEVVRQYIALMRANSSAVVDKL